MKSFHRDERVEVYFYIYFYIFIYIFLPSLVNQLMPNAYLQTSQFYLIFFFAFVMLIIIISSEPILLQGPNQISVKKGNKRKKKKEKREREYEKRERVCVCVRKNIIQVKWSVYNCIGVQTQKQGN